MKFLVAIVFLGHWTVESAVMAQDVASASYASNSVAVVHTEETSQIDGRPMLRWFHDHYPPTFIGRGPHKGQGYGDKTYEYLKAKLPQYRHEKIAATFNRGLAQIKDQDGVCVMGMFKTPEREEFVAFSDVMVKTLPNRLVVLKERKAIIEPFLSEQGEVLLDKLLTDAGMTGGLITDRFYSSRINAFIQAQAKPGKFVTLPEPRYGRLLSRNRIDYTFGFAYEAEYQFRIIGLPNAYTTYAIAGEPPLMYGHVGCSKMPLGMEAAAAITEAIKDAGDPPIYRAWMEEWLDENALVDYRKALSSEQN
jgi:uncharacterized protein (TIGR02285 family)